jgi:hypothetical protein
MKKKVMLIVLFLASYLYVSNVFAQSVEMHLGFLKGEHFLKLSESQKTSYSMGIIDGYFGAPMFGAKDKKELNWLYTCMSDKTATQLTAILTKHLKDNPDQWNWPMHILTFNTLKKLCNKE